MSSVELRLAYRHLYQHLLRAVQYSTRARYTARDRLRQTFRKGNQADFDQTKMDKTLEFLHGAATVRGLEHKIVKTLLFAWWHEPQTKTRSLSKVL